MDALAELAAEWGIEPDYVDGRGLSRAVDRPILRRIVEILSRGQSPPKRRWLPPSIVLRHGRSTAVALPDTPPSASIHWAVVAGDTEIASGTAGSAAWRLPDDLPVGPFRLDVEVKSRALPSPPGAGFHLDGGPERADRKIVGQTPSGRSGRAARDLGVARNHRPMDRSGRRRVGERNRGRTPAPKHDTWRQPATLRWALAAGENLDDPAQNRSIDRARKPPPIDIIRLDTPFGREFG